LVPPVAESLRCGRWKVASLRPTIEFPRQSPHPRIATLKSPDRPRSKPRRKPIEPRPLEHQRPAAVGERFEAAFLVWLVMELLAQANQHFWNLDFDWARRLTRATKARSVRQMMVCGQAVIKRREHGADWTSIDAAVGVAANAAINGAGIEARPAANAEQ